MNLLNIINDKIMLMSNNKVIMVSRDSVLDYPYFEISRYYPFQKGI